MTRSLGPQPRPPARPSAGGAAARPPRVPLAPPRPRARRPFPPRLLTFLGVACLTLLTDWRGPWSPEPGLPPPGASRDVIPLWNESVRRVEEDRHERVGRRVVVPVPPELLHYDDRRRFLAVQVAATRERDYTLPADEADLAALVRSGELVEMSPVGETYVLYGVGALATGEPFAHYDRESGLDIPLYPDYLAYEQADGGLDASVGKLQDRSARLRAERARLARGAVARRRALAGEIAAVERNADALARRQERTASLYDDYDARRSLAGKLRLLEETARARDCDLDDPAGRRALRARLASLVRPEARAVLLEVARTYHQSFGRPLPVTSLVRSQRYQERLRRTNPNATAIDSPPHATGLAFDVFTGNMTAVEQSLLLGEIARLEDAGRVEALFERNREHIHVFVFADGNRPPESLIADSLERVRPPVVLPRRGAVPAKGRASLPAAAKPPLSAVRGR